MLKTGLVIFMMILGLSLAHVKNSTDPLCKKDPPADVIPDECCIFPDLFTDETVEQCEYKFEPNNTRKHNDDYDVLEDLCVVECVFHDSNLIVADKLNPSALRDYFINQLTRTDASWSTVVNSTVNHCLESMTDENVKNYENEIVKEMKDKSKGNNKKCSPNAGYMLDCIYFELFLVCPADKFKSSDNCKELQNYAKVCDDW